ncbi:hypothetical protein [Streptomyces sp. CA-106131]|uniref:hypothetical protein n=1 Tax=Streptomyces sp. CA-106131 TaxID=3240045 RepID=UPI003D8DFC98
MTADLADGTFGASGDILVLWEISCLARETGKGVKLIDLCEAGGYRIHITSYERSYNPDSVSHSTTSTEVTSAISRAVSVSPKW